MFTFMIMASTNIGGGSSPIVYPEWNTFNNKLTIENTIPEKSATAKPILFDGMHDPLVNPGYQYTKWLFEEYSDVIDYKVTGVIDSYLLSQ